MTHNYLSRGEYNVTCDRCGRKLKSSQVSKEWTGLIVCRNCLDERHPQDFVRGVRDNMQVPIARPYPPLSFALDTTTYPISGNLQTLLLVGPENVFDYSNSIIVKINSGTLPSVTEADILGGANLVAVQNAQGDWEIAQYQNSLLVTGTTYNLSKLLRGKYGTYNNMGAPSGAKFIYIGQSSSSASQWITVNLGINIVN
jgi:hypothetical protein